MYKPGDRTGDRACPFNFFYWDFLDRHRQKLQSQGRMSFILQNLDKMSDSELQDIRQKAAEWHQSQGTKGCATVTISCPELKPEDVRRHACNADSSVE